MLLIYPYLRSLPALKVSLHWAHWCAFPWTPFSWFFLLPVVPNSFPRISLATVDMFNILVCGQGGLFSVAFTTPTRPGFFVWMQDPVSLQRAYLCVAFVTQVTFVSHRIMNSPFVGEQPLLGCKHFSTSRALNFIISQPAKNFPPSFNFPNFFHFPDSDPPCPKSLVIMAAHVPVYVRSVLGSCWRLSRWLEFLTCSLPPWHVGVSLSWEHEGH